MSSACQHINCVNQRILIFSHPLFFFFFTPDKRIPEGLLLSFSTNFAYQFAAMPYFHFFRTPDSRITHYIQFDPSAWVFDGPIPYFHFFFTPDKHIPEGLF